MSKFHNSKMIASVVLLGIGGMMRGEVSEKITYSVMQQKTTVTGIVTDPFGPVAGASVVIAGTTEGTATDSNGRYSLAVEPGQRIKVSFLGYKTQEVVYSGQKTLNFTLKEDASEIQEVVVTALGITKQAKSVGYATTKVSTDEILRTNTINPINALQGKVAGLNIQAVGASGVTSSSSITIRGAKSIDKNNSPIFVVDGMILQEPLKGNLDGTDWGSQLKNLNPADYESVTVLKGAAATALYGSRGANGAIVIVSKGGKYGKQGLGVEISQTLETINIYKSPIELQNVYGAGSPNNGFEGGFLADGSLQKTTRSFGPKMEGQLIDQYFLRGEKTPFVAQPDNWKALYDAGLNSTTNVAINGGGEKTSFRISYSYTDNNGVFKGNNFQRNSVSFRTNSQLNNVFSVEAGMNYAFSRAKNGASQGGWDWNNNLSMLTTYYMPRNMDLATYESVYRDPETHAVETDSPFGAIRSYLHNRDMNLRERSEQSMLANLTIRAQVLPWLEASVKANYNFYGISTQTRTYGTGINYGPSGSGSYARGGSNSGSYNFLGMVRGNHTFLNDELTLDAFIASEIYGNTESHGWSKSTNGGLVTPGFFAFSNSVNTIIPEYNYTPRNNKTVGLSGIINLGWRDQLFLELTGRNDWMSTMTYPSYMIGVSNNYSVFYPSANASWIANETLKLPVWISMAKLRASISRVGMGTAPYNTTKGYGVFNQTTIFDPDRNSVLVATPNLGTVQNKNLKPEVQQSIEIGADIRLFNENLNFDFAWYKTNTFNQIMSLPSVAESGANSILVNAGNIQNRGVEFSVDGTPIRTRDFRWTIGGNVTRNRGKIKKLHEDIKEWQLMGQYDGGPEIWAYEGGDFGVITTPYNSTTGGGIYRFNNEADASDPRNGKPVISYWGSAGSPNPVKVFGYVMDAEKGEKDRKVIGKVEPDFLASINTSFSYRDFDFYAQVDGRFGGNFYSNAYKYASSMGSLKSSLYGRDKEHGGLPRVNYKGETVYDGIMLDAVFDEGTVVKGKSGADVDLSGMMYKDAIDQDLIDPMMATAFYMYNMGWGMPSELGIQDNTWISLREISVGYRLPEKVLNKIKLQYLRVGVTARNLCFLYSKLTDGLNPDAISSNNPLTPMDIGGVPFSRTFSFTLNLKF